MKENKFTTEKNIDDYLIYSCIVLLASFVVLFSAKKPNEQLLSYLIIVSTFSLLVAFLGFLWHKFRHPYREYLFKQQKDRIIEEHASKIANFAESIIIPYFKLKLEKRISIENSFLDKIKSDEDFKKGLIKDETDKSTREVIESYVRNISEDLRKAYSRSFCQPLEEKYSKIKYYMDSLAERTRYYFFVIGLIFFFISICLSVLSG